MPGKKPDNWSPPVPLRDESLSDERVDALRRGDLVAAFGPEFSRAMLKSPMPLPGGMLKLVDRALRIEATGGRYGLGRIRCEADIHPDDWFLTCHFVDDQVMPGTLMYECCLHTLRVLLMRMGWVCEDGEARFEPVAGVASKLKCRGQVIATTKKVVYEISLKEIGFRPEPYVICDALMYADGKPIVDITNMSLRLVGMSRERLDAIWSAASGVALFTRDQVLEFATGNPSKAFGDRYFPFDRDRFIARLPGAPYSFIDRVTHIANCEPWKLAPGGSAVVEYDVPPDAWYFASNRCDYMPYCVLNEIALQACGWMAAYLGSALTSPDDLLFRNLGGNATQHRDVRPNVVTLTTNIKLTKVSPAAGMIILQFDFDTRNRDGSVYSGDTTFGFFTRTALATQVGLKDARLIQPPPSDSEGWTGPVSTDPPFPDAMLRMVDWIAWTEDGGRSRSDRIETIAERSSTMGIIEGRARVNPDAWFFKAHFYQDPVWPGSLGLESLVQLLKVFAHRRWGVARSRVGLVQDTEPALTRSVSEGGWQALVPGVPHRWTYRGQILPTATEVTIQAYITELDDSRRFLKADGLLAVDGRIIYQMNDFSVQG
jgi:3-hydroxymyristoyl/3-hydroxydecanoyl-(acyl carrier protein) dehydratase